MAGKYLNIVTGRYTQLTAPTTSAGAGDADKIPALDAAGKLDVSFMPSGIGADTVVALASEALSAGNFINMWNDAGTLKARKADATTSGKEANGYVLAAVSSGASATVYKDGVNSQVSGKTIGARQYLGTTAGASVETPPSGSANVVQYLGYAESATAIDFEPEDGVILA